MPYIARKTVTRYYVETPIPGKKKSKRTRATSTTPGAVKSTESTKCYYLFGDNDKVIKKLFTDKRASETALSDYVRSVERGEAGLTDPFAEAKAILPTSLVPDFMPAVKAKNEKYRDETERILTAALTAVAPERLEQLTTARIEDYLNGLEKAPNTKKKHHSALNMFCCWLFKRKMVAEHPMLMKVDVPEGGVEDENAARALTLEQVKELIKVAEGRPLSEALKIRRGPNMGGEKKLGENARRHYERLGRQRALVYCVAAMTGLRRSELGKLQVQYLTQDGHDCFLDVPKSVTKNKKAARFWIPSWLRVMVENWFAETGKAGADPWFKVPSHTTFNADRDAAGIPALTVDGKATLHSLRKTINKLLGKEKLTDFERQTFMRHSDPRLTTITYDGSKVTEMPAIGEALEKLRLA